MYIKDKTRLVVDRDKPKKLYFALWLMVLGLLSLIMFSLSMVDSLMSLLLSPLVILSHFYSLISSNGVLLHALKFGVSWEGWGGYGGGP